MSIVSVRIDRSEAFKQSLLEDCPALDTPYDKYWDPAGARPALILNTTWMSNGHRVAFAPFPLKAIGDGTLWSFDDLYQGLHPLYRNKPFSPSVADAVIASARFPAVLPPLGLTVGAHRHNFGDGGYADASGVTTALEIFQAAKRLAVKDPKIVPRLVMLTFDYEKVEAEKEDGTTFGETVAPISAILGVRENLAGQAITRAQALLGAEGEIWRVSLNPDDFGIALGLQLSRTSYETLSLLLGRPEWCKESPYDAGNPILKNSCVAQKVLDFVRKLG